MKVKNFYKVHRINYHKAELRGEILSAKIKECKQKLSQMITEKADNSKTLATSFEKWMNVENMKYNLDEITSHSSDGNAEIN